MSYLTLPVADRIGRVMVRIVGRMNDAVPIGEDSAAFLGTNHVEGNEEKEDIECIHPERPSLERPP